MTNKRDPVETRKMILKAAIYEFSAKGYNGARIENITSRSGTSTRMIYHYFGGKEKLYIATLEHVLGELREEELKQDITGEEPLEGMLKLFDFIQNHFATHPNLVSLMSTENILKARYLKKSSRIREHSSSLIKLIGELLMRGMDKGVFRPGLKPLQLYVAMVSLSYFHLSNAHTLSTLFQKDILSKEWRKDYRAQARCMLIGYLKTPTLRS